MLFRSRRPVAALSSALLCLGQVLSPAPGALLEPCFLPQHKTEEAEKEKRKGKGEQEGREQEEKAKTVSVDLSSLSKSFMDVLLGFALSPSIFCSYPRRPLAVFTAALVPLGRPPRAPPHILPEFPYLVLPVHEFLKLMLPTLPPTRIAPPALIRVNPPAPFFEGGCEHGM